MSLATKIKHILERLSHFSAFASVVIACYALYVGIHQFNLSIDKTDKQIEMMKEDRQRTIDDNRPYLTITKTKVKECKEYPPWPMAKFFSITYMIENIGTRPAGDVTIFTDVIGYGTEKNTDDIQHRGIVQKDTVDFSNPLTKGLIMSQDATVQFRTFKSFYVKTTLVYKDRLCPSCKLTEVYHWKCGDIINHTLNVDFFDEEFKQVNKRETALIDSLFKNTTVMKKLD